MRILLFGRDGKVGAVLMEALAEGGHDVEGVEVGEKLDPGGFDAAVDFTAPTAVRGNAVAALSAGTPCVIGTTGLQEADLEDIDRLAREQGLPCFVAPNFALGAVLMMAFAAKAARFYESVEVVELHHPDKVDAPSGTAARTADLIGAAREDAGLAPVPDATTDDPGGARGGRVHGIPVHSVRLRGLVAHQEVLLGTTGETLTLRHDSYDRVSFMPGVLLAVRSVPSRPGLTVGLEALLDL